jgi:hypothetical protein
MTNAERPPTKRSRTQAEGHDVWGPQRRGAWGMDQDGSTW